MVDRVENRYNAQPLEFVQGREPMRDSQGRLVVGRAVEITWGCAERMWQERISCLKQHVDLTNAQVLVLQPHLDVTRDLYTDLTQNPLGSHPVATTADQEFSDNELDINVVREAAGAEHVVIVASILDERDLVRVGRVANHYKSVLNAGAVSAVLSFMAATRQDKNVDKNGNYVSKPINIWGDLRMISGVVDFMSVLETHSSGTQAFAAMCGLPVAPLSPWATCFEQMFKDGVQIKDQDGGHVIWPNSENAVIIRPDKGRNTAARRAERLFGIPGVALNKVRISGQTVEYYDLSVEEQKLIDGRLAYCYDDEGATFGTLEKIGLALSRYGAKCLIAGVMHAKLTNGWDNKARSEMFNRIYLSNSREPIGTASLSDKIRMFTLTPLLRDLVSAHLVGCNYWQDPKYRPMVLQLCDGEVDC